MKAGRRQVVLAARALEENASRTGSGASRTGTRRVLASRAQEETPECDSLGLRWALAEGTNGHGLQYSGGFTCVTRGTTREFTSVGFATIAVWGALAQSERNGGFYMEKPPSVLPRTTTSAAITEAP